MEPTDHPLTMRDVLEKIELIVQRTAEQYSRPTNVGTTRQYYAPSGDHVIVRRTAAPYSDHAVVVDSERVLLNILADQIKRAIRELSDANTR